MFCQKCGSQVGPDTKFCNNCGAPQTSSPAPAPFQQYSSVDPAQPVYQNQVFHGKQYSTGSSGHVSFGGNAPKDRKSVV